MEILYLCLNLCYIAINRYIAMLTCTILMFKTNIGMILLLSIMRYSFMDIIQIEAYFTALTMLWMDNIKLFLCGTKIWKRLIG